MECLLTPEVIIPIAWACGVVGTVFGIAWVITTLIKYER